MHIRPNSAFKIATNQLVIVKTLLVINFKEIQEDSLMYGMIWSGLQSCSEAKLLQFTDKNILDDSYRIA